ncbi:MAG: single-stranded DNA-binding protein [Syntrophobacteraceae bacterium]|nr:single-stranded DNA-binding protein [Syntrophobacteraceae bacterium]
MARGTVNKVIIVGRLGSDPDVRYTSGGMAVANLSIATNERVPAGEGNWEERTEWHRVVVFGKQAESCGNYLSKGRLVFVEGSLRTKQWEDTQGIKRYTTEIVARDVQFLGGGEGQGRQQQEGERNYSRSENQGFSDRSSTEELPPAPDSKDDDIPF